MGQQNEIHILIAFSPCLCCCCWPVAKFFPEHVKVVTEWQHEHGMRHRLMTLKYLQYNQKQKRQETGMRKMHFGSTPFILMIASLKYDTVYLKKQSIHLGDNNIFITYKSKTCLALVWTKRAFVLKICDVQPAFMLLLLWHKCSQHLIIIQAGMKFMYIQIVGDIITIFGARASCCVSGHATITILCILISGVQWCCKRFWSTYKLCTF